jgi:hypothetical protein
MNRVTLMHVPLNSSFQVSPSRNHVHQMKLAAIVPPPLFKFESVNMTATSMPPILRLHFFNPIEPIIYDGNTSQDHPASSLRQPVMFSITVDVSNLIPLQFIIIDFKEQLLDALHLEPCAHGTQVKISVHCLNKMVVDNMMATIMRNLPSAEFGPIKCA